MGRRILFVAVVTMAGAAWGADPSTTAPATRPGGVRMGGPTMQLQLKVGAGGVVEGAVVQGGEIHVADVPAETRPAGEAQPGRVAGPIVGRAMGEGDWEKQRAEVLAAIRQAAEGSGAVDEKIRNITAGAMKMPGDAAVEAASRSALLQLGKEAAPKMRAAAAGQSGPEATLLLATAYQAEHGFSPVEGVLKWISEKSGKQEFVTHPQMVGEPALAELFKNKAFLTVTVPMWPVARQAPEPLGQQNVFVVFDINGQMEVRHVASAKELEDVFKSNLPAVKDEATAKQAMAAWLALSSEFSQDGMFQFVIDEKGMKYERDGAKSKVSGEAVVKGNGGNGGAVTAVLTFDDGKLVKVDETRQVRAGVRPICQSTKLLDADPIVRKMAERDILVMGSACREYLTEQRAKAPPELREAIDRIWRQILEEGR